MIFENLFDIFLSFLWKFAFIWHFYHLRIWPFLKLREAKFGLFYFLVPGTPVVEDICVCGGREPNSSQNFPIYGSRISFLDCLHQGSQTCGGFETPDIHDWLMRETLLVIFLRFLLGKNSVHLTRFDLYNIIKNFQKPFLQEKTWYPELFSTKEPLIYLFCKTQFLFLLFWTAYV